jgi:MoaA/NifB/PqqE/SkfB family radical SAM enzyme
VKPTYALVDADGDLKIPAEMAQAMGFAPGARVKLARLADRLVLHRSADHLARVYIEPTTACNLQCRTCMRNAWDERIGHMAPETFRRILEGIQALPNPPCIFFGGLGEPLAHPDILEMIREAARLPGPVEAITNGHLLDERRADALIDAGLETLWVSLDGVSAECYADVRVHGDFPRVMANLERLRDLKYRRRSKLPRLGIVFVAMRRNLAELSEVLKLEYRIGARKFLITNVYPHTPELLDESLYRRAIGEGLRTRSTIRMARFDVDRDTAWVLEQAIKGPAGARLEDLELFWPADACPFVLRGSTCVRWDGQVSPCLPLLHSHVSYLEERQRTITAHTFGSVLERPLPAIWASPDYAAFRARLDEFDFSPCTACNSCEKADENREDCLGNDAPACGGCLWAQGFIRCP